MRLEDKYQLAESILHHPALQEFLDAGLINPYIIRNYRIIYDYINMRVQYNHLDTLEILANKFYLSEERIQSILYKN